LNNGSGNLGTTAKLLMSLVDRVRRAAAHDMASEPDHDPVQRAYEVCLSKLSDEDRRDLVRVIKKLSQHGHRIEISAAHVSQQMPRWRAEYLDKHSSSHLGTVEAPDEKSAIEQAAKQFNITPARRHKIVVMRTQASEKPARESSG
jgi:hypothetical protein